MLPLINKDRLSEFSLVISFCPGPRILLHRLPFPGGLNSKHNTNVTQTLITDRSNGEEDLVSLLCSRLRPRVRGKDRVLNRILFSDT